MAGLNLNLKKSKRRKKSKKNKFGLNKQVFDTTFLTSDIGKEKEYFLENLALMLASGIDILDILESLEEEVTSKLVGKIIQQIKLDIVQGKTVAQALKKAQLLPEHLLYLIEVGEKTGRLSENMSIVIEQRKKDADFKGKLRSASLYPGFVLVLMTFIGLGVAVFILPRLSNVYESLDIDLPVTTRFILNLGDFLETNGIIAIPAFLLTMTLLIYFTFIYHRTKVIGQTILLNTPYIKRIIQEVEVSRFGFLLGSLLEAGLTVTESLELLKKSSPYKVYKDFYTYLEDSIITGRSFKQSFKSFDKIKKFMPLYARQLIYASEKSGKLSQALLLIGATYEKKNEETTKDLSVVIEPILLFIVWGAVAFLALSIILPVYNLVGDLNTVSDGDTAEELDTGPTDEQLDEAAILINEEISQADEDLLNILFESGIQEGDEVPSQVLQILGDTDNTVFIRDDIGGSILGAVQGQSRFEYINVTDGWYEIVLQDNSVAWINETQVEIIPIE